MPTTDFSQTKGMSTKVKCVNVIYDDLVMFPVPEQFFMPKTRVSL